MKNTPKDRTFTNSVEESVPEPDYCLQDYLPEQQYFSQQPESGDAEKVPAELNSFTQGRREEIIRDALNTLPNNV